MHAYTDRKAMGNIATSDNAVQRMGLASLVHCESVGSSNSTVVVLGNVAEKLDVLGFVEAVSFTWL